MVLRKITNDNSVRWIPRNEQKKGDTKPNTLKNKSRPRKQNKNLSQDNKKFIAGGFGILR